MSFSWRTPDTPLASHEDWLGRIDGKNRKPGTSAPTLALTWSGVLDLTRALAKQPAFVDVVIEEVLVEKRAVFDEYFGNVRNHDLLVKGHNGAGERVVICVEAKAGEALGATVAEQAKGAKEAKRKNPRSNASARLEDLVRRFCGTGADDPRVAQLRYQLLTAWAGTVADARGADHAALVVHEFRTDERPDDKTSSNAAELARFGQLALSADLPTDGSLPWCARVPDLEDVDAAMYVAHIVTDLRSAAITGGQAAPAGPASEERPDADDDRLLAEADLRACGLAPDHTGLWVDEDEAVCALVQTPHVLVGAVDITWPSVVPPPRRTLKSPTHILLPAEPEEVLQAVERARVVARPLRRTCRFCGGEFHVGRMDEEDVCHGCGERHLGNVY